MKVTFRIGENETENDFLLIRKNTNVLFEMWEKSGKCQHALVIADIDWMKIKKEVRKTCAERRKMTLLIDVKIRKRFEENVVKLVVVGGLIFLGGHFKDGV